MAQRFPTEDAAQHYVDVTPPGSVRMVSECGVCGVPAAVSTSAAWAIAPDLFDEWVVERVPAGQPTIDPCGHGARVWTRVVTAPNPGRPCGRACRDASSAFCSCSCNGANHGLRHHV